MFKHILLPTDGSELSNKAVKEALEVARVHGAKITTMNVMGLAFADLPTLERRLKAEEAARAKVMLEAVRRSASEAGVRCDTVTSISDAPYKAIINQAGKSGCDLIIMAFHGRKGLQALLLGNQTVKVLTHSTIPVLVCR